MAPSVAHPWINYEETVKEKEESPEKTTER